MKRILPAFGIIILLLTACSKEKKILPVDDLNGAKLAATIANANHKIELYTVNGKLQTGYNAILLQIKNTDGTPVNNASLNWSPVMHMESMNHSCPASAINKKEGATATYAGYIVFQMAGNETEYWELTINYSINGANYSAKQKIQVNAAPMRVVESFMGSDNNRYVVAMVEPATPRIAINTMKAVLYRMESMMSFVPVNGYKIKIDPRMPGMANHSSPNNVDLTQSAGSIYDGKLSLTMTGYWKINLQVENPAGTIIKGEAVTSENKSSSIYFELEF